VPYVVFGENGVDSSTQLTAGFAGSAEAVYQFLHIIIFLVLFPWKGFDSGEARKDGTRQKYPIGRRGYVISREKI
jgi:hypothetical protein